MFSLIVVRENNRHYLRRLYYSGSAAKSHSTTTKYRQLRRLRKQQQIRTSHGYFILATDPWSQGSQSEEMSANNFSEQSACTCHFEQSQFQVISSFTVISQLRQPACSLVTSHKRRLNAAFLTWNIKPQIRSHLQ